LEMAYNECVKCLQTVVDLVIVLERKEELYPQLKDNNT
jgi:hypothetical protein